MAKIHKFNPVIYPYYLWVIVDKEPTCISESFNEYNGSPINYVEEDTKRWEAFTMPVIWKKGRKYGVVIFFRSKKSMTFELVAHEASHAAKYLFEHIGADMAQHEPFEYVIGWIAGCCEKVKQGKI